VITGQNVGLDSAEHFKEDPGVGPFSESREPRPEQSGDREDLPDAENVQDISWIADGADLLYDIGKVRKVHESSRHEFQNKNGGAHYVDISSLHSSRPSILSSERWLL
jgi:hypothetical protein